MFLEQSEKNTAYFFNNASISLMPNKVKHIKKRKKNLWTSVPWHTPKPLKMINRLNPTIVEPSSQFILGA